jgi:hypothetical protein
VHKRVEVLLCLYVVGVFTVFAYTTLGYQFYLEKIMATELQKWKEKAASVEKAYKDLFDVIDRCDTLGADVDEAEIATYMIIRVNKLNKFIEDLS